MIRLVKISIKGLILICLSSCTPGPPYEVKSPCVSIDSNDPFIRNPCIRRPANINHDIV